MATVEEGDLDRAEKPSGFVAQVGATTYKVVEEGSNVVYGATGRPLWPVALLAVAGAALMLDGAVAGIVGVLALILVAVWVGAKR